MLLLAPGIGEAWEEPGWRGYALARICPGEDMPWRGYALPWLSQDRPQWLAGLWLAIILSGWHLRLLIEGMIRASDLLYLLGTLVLFNWLYYRAGKSVLIIMLFPAMNNAAHTYFPALFPESYHEQLALLQAIICVLFGLSLLLADRPFWTGALDQVVTHLPASQQS